MGRSLRGAFRGTAMAAAAFALLVGLVAAAPAPASTPTPTPIPAPRHTGVASDTPIGQPGAGAGQAAAGQPGAAPSTAAPGATTPDPAGTGSGTETAAPGDDLAAGLPGWLHTDGATIETADGSPYVIKAIAWFGMETGNCAPHGLWSISLDAGLAQIASMGFNTVRLPYSNECLSAVASNSINAAVNPGLAGLTPLQLMDAFVQTAKSYGLSVILDRHRPDSGAQSALWYTAQYPESTWIADWTMLAQRYAAEPAVIGFDLHNEPHGEACWGCGDPATDWQAAATRAGDAVLAVNPELLIIVEGVEQQGDGSFTWWGGGLRDAGSAPVSLAVPDRVVYSPHDYPASIYAQSWFTAADYPANLPGVWDENWGYLAKQNVAPVLLGEFGSKLQTDQDRAWFETIVSYLATNGMSFSYWSFNPNSGDTGGIVHDDWVTPQAEKVAALGPLLGAGSAVAPHSAVPVPSPDPVPSATPVPPSSSSASPSPVPASPLPTPGSSAAPSKISGSASSRNPGPIVVPGETGSLAELSAGWDLQSEWPGGYVTELTVSNRGGSAAGWTASWPDATATGVVNAWGMDCTVASGTVTCTGADWAASVTPGQAVTAGVQLTSSGAAPVTPTLSIAPR
ncbi:cellulase family glycosylhydrolase [Herbiconiux sp.]|uniref:cellulase family glycosylhydrolase n=1 Tax=Herbiconiux sp. TaxID=1871186 RepID=UPI0025BBC62F|nr:cellulase family glycosylhydrolase [Herbiconiux sp.]